jgi:hypothetical protein
VEKLLQREGRTALKLDTWPSSWASSRRRLFEVVGKDEFSLRNIENLLRPAPPPAAADEAPLIKRSRSHSGGGGVLVVGVGSLMTTLARCCRPAPPDAIGGFVTRGKGVAIHRRDCSNFRHMAARFPGREIEVQWGRGRHDKPAVYPLDVSIEADDRQGLLRDISEVFAKEKLNVTAVNTQSQRGRAGYGQHGLHGRSRGRGPAVPGAARGVACAGRAPRRGALMFSSRRETPHRWRHGVRLLESAAPVAFGCCRSPSACLLPAAARPRAPTPVPVASAR